LLRSAEYGEPVTRIFVVDAFSEVPFGGNPAGVVLLEGPASADWMQDVAAEMRHSETAFVEPPASDGVRPLRWFTPAAEVELCGHATLASAHVLDGSAKFETSSGLLECVRAPDGVIWMDFPADPPEPIAGTDEGFAFVTGCDVVAAARGKFDLLLEVGSASEVRNVTVAYEALAREPYRGVIVTAAAGQGTDIVSRCFYPRVGVPEDPVTGSAHCTLASWWSNKLGRNRLTAEQASPRGGVVMIEMRGDRVRLGGRCSTVLEGDLVSVGSGSPAGSSGLR
jgi:predicted PhzF superfamily epimerase YddE/YHI9